MSDETFTAGEQLQSAQADCVALLTILGRHRHRLSALERATLDAISERHGHVVPTSTSSTPTLTSTSTSEHLVRSTSRLDDPLAGLSPEQRAACEAELALLGRRR